MLKHGKPMMNYYTRVVIYYLNMASRQIVSLVKLIVIYLIFNPVLVEGQTKLLDSTLKIIESSKKFDTSYVNLRNKYLRTKLIVSPRDSTLLKFAHESLKASEKLDYKEGKLKSLENIALVYQYVFSNPYQAIEYTNKVISIAEKDKSLEKYLYSSYSNIGVIYKEQGEYYKSLEYYRRSLKYVPDNITTLVNMAGIQGSLLRLDSALFYYKKAIKIGEYTNKDHVYLANAYNNYSLVLNRLFWTQEALKVIEKSIILVEKHELNILKAHTYKVAADIYLNLEEDEKAKKYVLKSLKYSNLINSRFAKRSVYTTICNFYKNRGEYKKAYEFLEKYIVLNDSLNSNNRKLEISRKEIQFEADRKQLLADEEIKRQKLIKNSGFLGGGLLIVILIAGALSFKRKRETEFKLQTTNAELKALRIQMNPHFIFSTLNSVNNYISKTNGAANSYLTQFSKLMRATLENSENEEITLEKDIGLLENYLEIEQKISQNTFTYDICIDDQINEENLLVPPMLFQPIVENSIKHGISGLDGNGKIIISLTEEDNMLKCIIDDNGVGRKATKRQQLNENDTTSMSTNILKKRLDIINQRYKTKTVFEIIDREKGTRVVMKLPIIKLF